MTTEFPTTFPPESKTSVEPDDVFWVMKYTPRPDLPSGNVRATEELEFEGPMALAVLLMNEVIFINDHWWEKEWPEEARKTTSLNVNCNDVFAWGCADAEEIRHGQLEELYRLWVEFPGWGPALWCCLQRKQMPQEPVAKSMRASGIDIDARIAAVQGKANHYDGVSGVISNLKYQAYTQWMRSKGEEPLEKNATWWNGWREFTQAVPGWYNDEWKKQQDAAIHQWRLENGYVEDAANGTQPHVQDPSSEPADAS